MTSREEALKKAIELRYGSVPKFCAATGIAPSTVYNIFDRGVENTRTKTMDTIYYYVNLDEFGEDNELDDDEKRLLEMFGKLSDNKRRAVLSMVAAMFEE